MIIWAIGLAGSGKTSIGQELASIMRSKDKATVFLDGDHFRNIMGNDIGHSLDDRSQNGWRICRMCEFLDDQDITVVCSILSLFPKQRAWCRTTFSDYFEVFIDVSMKELESRDQKGLYSGAREGRIKNVAGIDLEFPYPEDADFVFDNNQSLTDFKNAAKTIVDAIEDRCP
ncbi:MAG: adenylyl-sulfate kinase [Rhodospirillales bacterium]|jgi:cytidine diphosphoramidate kinase|nr:adenylyl-sulfate kinase [Rhodospirillales bacterium]